MEHLMSFISDPLVQNSLLSVATVLITELSKRFGISPNIVAGAFSIILATIFYVVIQTIPQQSLATFSVHMVAIYGGATALYKLYKTFILSKK